MSRKVRLLMRTRNTSFRNTVLLAAVGIASFSLGRTRRRASAADQTRLQTTPKRCWTRAERPFASTPLAMKPFGATPSSFTRRSPAPGREGWGQA